MKKTIAVIFLALMAIYGFAFSSGMGLDLGLGLGGSGSSCGSGYKVLIDSAGVYIKDSGGNFICAVE